MSSRPAPAPALLSREQEDARWDRLAAQLLDSLFLGKRPPSLDPELAAFLRVFVRRRVARFEARLRGAGFGIDADDVAQRVFLRLLESPPRDATHGRAMRRLVAWVSAVSHNYLCDLASQRAELLAQGDDAVPSERTSGVDVVPPDDRYAARETLRRARPLVAREYPAGLALFDALLARPDAASHELSVRLGTSGANVDQMRSRLRRVLRRLLENGGEGER